MIDTLGLLVDSIVQINKSDSISFALKLYESKFPKTTFDYFKDYWQLFSSLIAFFLAFSLTWIRDKRKEYKYLIGIRDFVYVWIENSKISLDLQIQYIDDLLKRCEDKDNDNFTLKVLQESSFEVLQKIDSIDMANIFFKNKKGDLNKNAELYSKLLQNISQLTFVFKRIVEYHSKLIANSEKQNFIFFDSLTNINSYLDINCKSDKIKRKKELASELNLFLCNYNKLVSKNENFKRNSILNNFILPLEGFILLNDNGSIISYEKLIEALNDAKASIKYMHIEQPRLIMQMREYKENLRSSHQHLLNIITEMKTIKTKPWYKF